jgi:D-xylose transport system substrate-binding protein
MSRLSRSTAILAVGVLIIGSAAACGSDKKTSTTKKSGTIALLLPETKTARYEAHDRPEFVAAFKALCSDCNILYYNANQDAALQQNQVDQALTNGAKVLVLDPVDSASAASLVAKAKAQNVPVVSYDRLITGGGKPDYYVSFDNEQVGTLQGTALLTALGATPKAGKIVMINGSPQDNNAKLFSKGAHSVLDGKVTIGKEYWTPDWSPDNAQREMEQAITALGKATIKGVYAANDGTAGGAIAAMKAAGFTTLPPVTGQDAELAAIQRILAGDQYMTVYKATKAEATAAAQLAYDLLQGKTSTQTTKPVNNGTIDVPSVLLTPVAVTADKVKDTVVADGFWKASDICTAAYAAACTKYSVS